MNDQPTTNNRSTRRARAIAESRARALELVARAREVLSQPRPDSDVGRQHDTSHSEAAAGARPVCMNDMQSHLKTLRAKIDECKRLERASKRPVRRDVFKRLAAHYKVLADELERAIAQTSNDQETKQQE